MKHITKVSLSGMNMAPCSINTLWYVFRDLSELEKESHQRANNFVGKLVFSEVML